MQSLRQVFRLTWLGLLTLRARAGAVAVIVVGIAGVVGVLVSLLAMRDGFQATLMATGRGDEVIVLRGGANAEVSSHLTREDLRAVEQAPGILRDEAGRPLVSGAVVVVLNLPKIATGTDANVELRGVGAQGLRLHDNVRVQTGRPFMPGKRELIAGRGAVSQFAGLQLGGQVVLSGQPWQVVGVFESGDAHESEIWADAEAVQSAYRRDGYESITARLSDPAAFADLQNTLADDPRLKVDVQRTRDYYATQSQRLRGLIEILAFTVATIMGIGATFAALNTLYAAVATRGRDIAIRRAIGFGRTAIVLAVLLEALALALLGGLLGGGVAWLLFDQYTVSTLGQNFSQVVFAFAVSWPLVLRALGWALVIGFIGGLLPALQAARLPLPLALRAH